MKNLEKIGSIIGARQVLAKQDVMVVSDKGQMIRVGVSGISEQGRMAQGVRVMNVAPGEKVVSMEPMPEEEVEVDGTVTSGEAPTS